MQKKLVNEFSQNAYVKKSKTLKLSKENESEESYDDEEDLDEESRN